MAKKKGIGRKKAGARRQVAGPPQERKLGHGWTSFILILLVGLMIVAGLAFWPGWNWIAVLVLMFAFVIVLGVAINGRPLGILINERNRISLSRFQMVLWTLLVLSAYFVVALARIQADVANPLEVVIPWQVWSLVGISTTALVGTPFISSIKKRKKPADEKAISDAAKVVGEKRDVVEQTKQGILYSEEKPSKASITNMFEGDELINARNVDVGKLQMFLFTVIVAVTFATEVFQLISVKDLTGSVALPTVHGGLLALMGISNAGYLGSKAVDQTAAKRKY